MNEMGGPHRFLKSMKLMKHLSMILMTMSIIITVVKIKKCNQSKMCVRTIIIYCSTFFTAIKLSLYEFSPNFNLMLLMHYEVFEQTDFSTRLLLILKILFRYIGT